MIGKSEGITAFTARDTDGNGRFIIGILDKDGELVDGSCLMADADYARKLGEMLIEKADAMESGRFDFGEEERRKTLS